MTVSALVREVQTHLQEIQSDTSKSLNEKLLESINRQITGATRC